MSAPDTTTSTTSAAATARTLAHGALSARIATSADGMPELQLRRAGASVLGAIRLGLTLDGVALGPGSALVGWQTESVVESFTMRTGKAAGPHEARHEQAVATLRDAATGREWQVVLRVATDGVAFRYRLPGDAAVIALGREATTVALPAGARVWPLEYQTYYETPRFGAELDQLADGEYGFPFLLRQADGTCVLISESAIDGRFSGAHAVVSGAAGAHGTAAEDEDAAAGRRLGIVTADALAARELETPGGTELPWRVLVIGGLDTIAGSSLVDELAPAADPELAAAGWIRPGRAAWSWWSAPGSPADPVAQRRFVDFAAAHGWEYTLVDAGWDATWVPGLVAYARERGVQVFLWSHWEELPQGEASVAALALWKSWGVAGVKVDFMESEARERYRWYDWIIAETGRLELMVNFHGSVIPRGWARTFPHVMSYEGIRGAEYYIMDMPSPTAAHNVIQPFTRNVVGSMDYTPVTFGPRAADRETSDGHELALGVVFESGITHFADEVAEYEARPLATAFLDRLPASWDETRLLSGTPDTEVVVARRSGDRWFIGGIAAGPARTVSFDVSALVAGAYDAWLVTDAGAARGLVESRLSAAVAAELSIAVADDGGFVAVLAPTS